MTAKEMGERDKDLEDKKKCLRLLVAFVVSSFLSLLALARRGDPLFSLLTASTVDTGLSKASLAWGVRNRLGW